MEGNKSNDVVTVVQEENVILEWILYFLKKWQILTIAGVIGGVLGFWYASVSKVNYESRLTFALDDGGGNSASSTASLVASQFGINIGGGNKTFFSGDNIPEILKSRRIVEKVLLSSDTINGIYGTLIEHYQKFTLTPEELTELKARFPVGQDKSTFSYLQDSILYVTAIQFSKQIISAKKPDKKLDIYEVKIKSPNEKFTKVFTDRIVQEMINFYTELRSSKGKQMLEILEQRVAYMRGNLSGSISEKAAVQDANINPAFATAQVPILKQQANMQVYGAAYAELFKNMEMARVDYLRDRPLLQIIDDADYPMKKIKKSKLLMAIVFAFALSFIVISFMVIIRNIKKIKQKQRIIKKMEHV